MRSAGPPPPEALRAIVAALDPALRLTGSRELTGGVSARVTAIETRLPGGTGPAFVLREYGAANLASDPHAARHEFALLTLLYRAGLPVPRPCLADESGLVLPGPWLVTEFVDGRAICEPGEPDGTVICQFATTLAAIHQAGFGLAEAPYLTDIREFSAPRVGTWPVTPDESLNEAAIRTALDGRWPPPVVNEPRLLHCDFWPGNTLWRDGMLVSVIDWEDALLGDPLADLGNTRLELAMFFGTAAAAEFTRYYRGLMPGLDVATLPYWDLYGALRPAGKMAGWGMPAARLATMTARHRSFTAGVLDQLPPGRRTAAGS
jgi:aminoglycoside phosphotransferase (APT) family kinase protein